MPPSGPDFQPSQSIYSHANQFSPIIEIPNTENGTKLRQLLGILNQINTVAERLEYLIRVAKDWGYPQMVLSVDSLVNGDTKQIFYQEYGNADHRAIPLDSSIYFDLASVTKPFTITLYHWLCESYPGNLPTPSTTLSSLLKEFENTEFGDITIAQLINHTSRLGFNEEYRFQKKDVQTPSHIQKIYLRPNTYLQSEAPVNYFDANIILFVLGIERWLENVSHVELTGKKMIDLHTLMYERLRIRGITTEPEGVSTSSIAHSVNDDTGELIRGPRDFKARAMDTIAHAGLFATLEGMRTFFKMLFGGEILGDPNLTFSGDSGPNGQKFNQCGFVQSPLIPDSLYVRGNTGAAVIYSPAQRTLVCTMSNLFVNERQDQANENSGRFMYFLSALNYAVTLPAR